MIKTLVPPTGHRIFITDFFGSIKDYPLKGYLFNSGTTALYFLISNLKIPEKSNILIPAYSCPSIAAAILRAGHFPVLCDINKNTFGYDEALLKQKIKKENIKSLIWVNLFGIKNKIPRLDIPIILDNAQAIQDNSYINSNCAGYVYSFGRGKPLNSLAGGIAIVEKNEFYYNLSDEFKNSENYPINDVIKYILNALSYKIFYHPVLYRILYSIPYLHLGETIFNPDFNISKMNKFNMRVIKHIISRLEKIQLMREQICNHYDKMLEKFSDKLIYFQNKIFYRYPVIIKTEHIRDKIVNDLQNIGIGAFQFYPVPLNIQPGLQNILKDSEKYPGAEFVSRNLFTLPVNEFVNAKIHKGIEKILKNHLD